jgi:ABC-2 type transport system permease protein
VINPMPEWLVIARREFSVRVRTTWFIIVTLLGPVGMVGLILVPAWLNSRAADNDVTIRMLDATGDDAGDDAGALGPTLTTAISATNPRWKIELLDAREHDEAEAMAALRRDEIDGYVVIPADLLAGGEVVYRGANATNFQFLMGFRGTIQQAVQLIRWERAALDPALYVTIHTPIGWKSEHSTGETTGVSGEASFILGYAVMFVLYMAILLYAVNVMRSVVEEKSSRVV